MAARTFVGEGLRARARAAGPTGSRSMRTICCFAEWMPPASTRVFVGVRNPSGRITPDGLTRRGNALATARPASSRPDQAVEVDLAAERGDVVRRVAAAARHDRRRVVAEDQHGRLARHPRDLARQELVGDHVADDRDAALPERVDEGEQARLPFALARLGSGGTGCLHSHCLSPEP